MTVVHDRLFGAADAEEPSGAPPYGGAAGASASEEPDYRFVTALDLRFVRGYVVNRRTGEVLASVIADVVRERRERKWGSS